MQFSLRKGLIISLKPEGGAAFAEKTDGSRTAIARIQMELIPVPFALMVMLTLWWKRGVGSRFHLSSGIGNDFPLIPNKPAHIYCIFSEVLPTHTS